MKQNQKIIITLFISFLSSIAYSQITTFNFRYNGTIPPSCNPFSTSTNFIDAWKPSHGSPEAGDIYSQNNFTEGKLTGSWKSPDAKEKGEGIFIAYNFQGTHLYQITVKSAHDKGDNVGFQVFAANGLTEKSNSDCSVAEIPVVSDKKEILFTNSVYDGPTGNFETTVNPFDPTGTTYSYLWILSRQNYGSSGSLFVDQIMIEDLGLAPTTPTPTPTCGASPNTDPLALKLSLPDTFQKRFGYAVSSDGNYFVVGAFGENKAYVYKKENCQVQLKATLIGDNVSGRFGFAVDIYNDQLIVGDPTTQAIYIYKRNGEDWQRVSKLLAPADLSTTSQYGFAVSIFENFLSVGAPGAGSNNGKIIFYEKAINGSWEYNSYFLGQPNANLGNSIDIKANVAIAGEIGDHGVQFFKLVTTNGIHFWIPTVGFINTSGKYYPSYNKFGVHVEFSGDGKFGYVSGGQLGEDYSTILIFEFQNEIWVHTTTIVNPSVLGMYDFSINENQLVYCDGIYVSFFEKINGSWQNQRIIRPAGNRYNDDFGNSDGGRSGTKTGTSLSLTNDLILIGASEPSCSYSGSTYVYDIFALLHKDNIVECNRTITGAEGTRNAKTIKIGCESGVTYNAGSSVIYQANSITISPNTMIKSGSSFSAKACGCGFGTSPNARIGVDNGNEDERSSKSHIEYIPATSSDLIRIEDQSVLIYPNPVSSNYVNILSRQGKIEQVEVYSLQGQLIDDTKLNNRSDNLIEVNLPPDAHGIFTIKIIVNGKVNVQKLIVQ